MNWHFTLRVSEQWDRIQTCATEAANLAHEIGNGPAEGRALATIAFVQYIRSDLKPALANCMQALRLATGDALIDAQIRVVLGMVQWSLGNFDEALRHIERSLPVLRELKDRNTEAFATRQREVFCTAWANMISPWPVTRMRWSYSAPKAWMWVSDERFQAWEAPTRLLD